MFRRQVNKGAVGETVVLHEHEVPNLYHFRVVFVHKVASVDFLACLVVADVDMNLGAWSARSCLTHLPEIVFL